MTPVAPVDVWTGWSAARFAVYIHFPYCLSKCPYCDFASIGAKQIPSERYAKAVLRELSLRAPTVDRRPVEAVFFGGGTPSLWAPQYVGAVLRGIGEAFPMSQGCEVTLEANPGAADEAAFAGYRQVGVNRLSIGVQSFDAATLKKLGRAHDAATAERAFQTARAAGFSNVSMDFIYGVFGQTVDEVRADAERAASWGSEHLSAYALTLDAESLAEEVPLAKQLSRKEVELPKESIVVEMQRAVAEVYERAGLSRYEISNYAKPSFHSRHNSAYWTGGTWLALGVGATGSLGPHRYANHRSAERYLAAVEAGVLPEKSTETLTNLELFEERVAMGLRLSSGLNLRAVCEHFGQPYEPRALWVERFLTEGLATLDGDRFRLTDRGMDVHSAIAARLM